MKSSVVSLDRSDRPLRGVTPDEQSRFDRGDELFEAIAREPDGLGPVYIRASCNACHAGDARGPGVVTRVASTQELPHGDVERPYVNGGGKTPLIVPNEAASRKTHRLPPAVYGRGYLEAVADSEIERIATAASRRQGQVRGRIHRVTYRAKENPEDATHRHKEGQGSLIGRFGLKARIATLDEFTADALQGDMGLTNALRPTELPNPDALTDDSRPGVDFSLERVNALTDYVRLLEIPERPEATERQLELFERAQCAVCHVPSLRTRDDYPIRALAGIDAWVYTDMLLHDMGDALDDGVREGEATGRDWRTAPLLGLRFFAGYMHDGRAHTVLEAILMHRGPGSEANDAVDSFEALTEGERDELVRFVASL